MRKEEIIGNKSIFSYFILYPNLLLSLIIILGCIKKFSFLRLIIGLIYFIVIFIPLIFKLLQPSIVVICNKNGVIINKKIKKIEIPYSNISYCTLVKGVMGIKYNKKILLISGVKGISDIFIFITNRLYKN